MDEKIKLMLFDFVAEIRSVLRGAFVKSILYGSYARGDYDEHSDIDIMVLTTLPNAEIEKVENAIYDLAYEYLLREGITISVNIINEEHFKYWLGALPYYDNVDKEGLILAG